MAIIKHAHGFELFAEGRSGGAATPPAVANGFDLLPELLDDVSGVTVGVVDTGITLLDGKPLPWFKDRVLFETDDEDKPFPDAARHLVVDGHGTFVAGLVLNRAPQVRVRMSGALDAETLRTSGLRADDDAVVAKAIQVLTSQPDVRVLNLSFGGGVFETEQPEELRQVLDDIDRDRIAVVAAAGNDSSARPAWPAAFPGVVAVGALDTTTYAADGSHPVAAFSNHGDWVDAFAPGVALLGPRWVTDRDGKPVPGWARWSGTSFAAAIVSGRIAARAARDDLSGPEAWEAIRSESPVVNGYQGARLIV